MPDYATTKFWIEPRTRVGVHVQNATDGGRGIPSLRLGGEGFQPMVDIPVYGYDKAETLAGLERLRAAVDLLIGMIETSTDGEQDLDALPSRWAPFPPESDTPLGIEDDVAGEAVPA